MTSSSLNSSSWKVWSSGNRGFFRLAQLNTILQEVASLEMSAAMVQSQWTQAGGRPGPKLKSTIERVQKILETLLVHIGQAEQLAEAARNRLVPQIQTEVKARQMRRAYQAAGQPSVAE